MGKLRPTVVTQQMLILLSGGVELRAVRAKQGKDSGFILMGGSVFKGSGREDIREQIWKNF